MKTLKFLSLFLFAGILTTACSSDDNPEPVHEEEVITTMIIRLAPDGSLGTIITLKTTDLDGDGPNAPVVEVSGNLSAGTTYNGTITLLNETENPAEDITEEVEGESDEHQFFYTTSASLNATLSYANFDGNNEPLGTEFTLVTGAASTGTLTFTLRHEPTKPNTGLADAGGETDIVETFTVTIN